ncbi:caspase family protein [Candidatus Ponderosibacter sp. Uisw_141_02]|uniref:caspase family protein n=1 Tax=Candidatus Ponderosibacter sp. Uisw_141_02 TaxID=3231000 RepID=UPI003D3B7CF0
MNNSSKIIYVLLCLGLFYDVPSYGKNWNTDDPTKIADMPIRRVPTTFPNVVTRVFLKCEDSNQKKFQLGFKGFFDNEMFYGSFGSISSSGFKMYRGRRVSRDRFEIRVSEASSKWRDNLDWMTFNIRGKNLTEALLSKKVIGEYSSGSFWRKCSMFIYQPDEINISINARAAQLTVLAQNQEYVLKKMGKLGLNFGFKYDFSGAKESLLAEAKSGSQKERTLTLNHKQNLATTGAQKKKAEEERLAAAETAKKKAEEIARLKAVEEARRKAEEVVRLAAVEATRKKAEEEARLAAAEAARKKAEEEKRQAEIELARKQKAEKSKLLALEKLQKKAEEEARLAAAEAARKKAEEEARLAAAEAAKKKAEEEARLAAAEAARKKAEEEARLAAAEAAKKKAEEEARLAAAEAARKKAEEEARLAAAEAARKKAEEEAGIAAADAAKKEAEQQKLATTSTDKIPPKILAEIIKAEGAKAIVEGVITDNVTIKFARAGKETLNIDDEGKFRQEVYIPRNGKLVKITAEDAAGNSSTFDLFLERGKIDKTTRVMFAELNPVKRDAKKNKNAIALIVGIADYERTSARAAYADDDAKYFYDYATLKLGVPENKILELTNEKADLVELKIASKNWLKRMVSPRQSDVFVFFAGHGMASDNGNNMFLLPYDGAPELLEESAIRRDVLFGDIDATNPRSVTVFLDTCYSGTSRSEEQLVSARPVSIKAKPQSIPKKFTVITAAGNDQTAKPLEEVKHGMFSYFVMRGLEGDADGNSDKKITAGELHKYVQKNVDRYSAGSQTPQIQGNADAVLVRFQ